MGGLTDPTGRGTVLVIGDSPGVAIARRLAAGVGAVVRVVDRGSPEAREADLLSGVKSGLPPGFFPYLPRGVPPAPAGDIYRIDLRATAALHVR